MATRNDMFEFKYQIDISITHPNKTLTHLKEVLDVTPILITTSGEERLISQKHNLIRQAKYSHFKACLQPKASNEENNLDINKALNENCKKLRDITELAKEIRNEGGEASLVLKIFSEKTYGTTVIHSETLNTIYDCGFDLQIEVIPN